MIVIPMAGLSRRFTDAGYKVPKYMLPLHGQSVFWHSVKSFSAFFSHEPFLFICRDVADTPAFIRAECAKLGIAQIVVCPLEQETSGQAETVELGLVQSDAPANQPITIFNIDTFRNNFNFPSVNWFKTSDGYLEVFKGTGPNWSYVEPMPDEPEPRVKRTTEKVPVSDLCCDGLYHFARASDFIYALAQERANPTMPELYVAPLYNHLMAIGRRIHYQVIKDTEITFCGVPSEYEHLLTQIVVP